jgi:hypothetical protein
VNEVLKAAVQIQEFCEKQRWPFCIIGGLAVLRWGEARETVDVDVTLLTGFGGEEKFIDTLLTKFAARIDSPNAFALRNRVLLIKNDAGVGLDVALGALPFEESAIQRSSKFQFAPQVLLRTCTAEDLIVFKAFAAREKDWMDIDGILVRQIKRLDWNYITDQLGPLAEIKGQPEILHELEIRRTKSEAS